MVGVHPIGGVGTRWSAGGTQVTLQLGAAFGSLWDLSYPPRPPPPSSIYVELYVSRFVFFPVFLSRLYTKKVR